MCSEKYALHLSRSIISCVFIPRAILHIAYTIFIFQFFRVSQISYLSYTICNCIGFVTQKLLVLVSEISERGCTDAGRSTMDRAHRVHATDRVSFDGALKTAEETERMDGISRPERFSPLVVSFLSVFTWLERL